MQPSETLWSAAEKDTWLGLIRMMSQVNRRLSADMEQQDGLPIAWYDVLVHLALAPEAGWSMQDLAAQVMMSGSGLTRLVDRMIDAGLVQRQRADERQAEDRRVVRVVLTEAGRTLIERVRPLHQQRVRHYFLQHLSETELGCITGACERVLSKLSQEDMPHV
jgi:DNA-binding MarR family transcriptional regulator